MRQGNFERGAENMLPKAVRDVLKSGRYATQGALTLKGDPVVDRVNAWNTIWQAMGFSPFAVSEAYNERSAKLGLQNRIDTRRQQAMNEYALAVMQDDNAGIRDAAEGISQFNQAYPEKAITTEGLRTSIRTRYRNQQRRAAGVGGMALDPKLEGRITTELGY
jgi:hypothetical protein